MTGVAFLVPVLPLKTIQFSGVLHLSDGIVEQIGQIGSGLQTNGVFPDVIGIISLAVDNSELAVDALVHSVFIGNRFLNKGRIESDLCEHMTDDMSRSYLNESIFCVKGSLNAFSTRTDQKVVVCVKVAIHLCEGLIATQAHHAIRLPFSERSIRYLRLVGKVFE